MTIRTLIDRRRSLGAAVLLALFILTLHAAVIVHTLSRSLDHDEGEHLRAGEWIAAGKTIYVDFAENHTPFLHQLLATFAPTALDFHQLQQYIWNARLLTTLVGTIAVLCVAAFAARIAGNALAAIPAMAVLLLPGWSLQRVVADVRPEPYTLLLFWGGVLLITRDVSKRGGVILGAVGAGLVMATGVWNPKWPIETILILAWWAADVFGAQRRSWRTVAVSLLIAALPPLLLIATALRVTTLPRLIFFGYRYPAAFYQWFGRVPLVQKTFRFQGPFDYCPGAFEPLVAIPAILLFAIALRYAWSRLTPRQRRLILLLAALIIAAAIEVRFLYSWPRLWPQYFVMWGCGLAALYGVTLTILWKEPARPLLAATAVIAGIYATAAILATREVVDESHWGVAAAILVRLRPGEGVWLVPPDSALPAPAGSYYWYAFPDQVPFSLEWARTPAARKWLPQISDADLPPCRMLEAHLYGMKRGDTYVRFIDGRVPENLPQSNGCTAILLQHGLARRLGPFGILEVARPRHVR